MRYQFTKEQQKAWPITLMCKVLRVSRNSYYDLTVHGLSAHGQLNNELDRRIRAISADHRERHGAPRIAQTLRHEDFACSENRIARRMHGLVLQAIHVKKFKAMTDSKYSKRVVPDLLKQDFVATAPNQKWTSDITYSWTGE